MQEDWTAPRFRSLDQAIVRARELALGNREVQVITVVADAGRAGFEIYSGSDYENLKTKALLHKQAPIGAVNGFGRFEWEAKFIID